MTHYKIERWDAILVNDERVPAIYIKPDITFLEFISKNSNSVVASINNTKTNFCLSLLQSISDNWMIPVIKWSISAKPESEN